MRFYHASRFLFPRSYAVRMFALSFGAVHVPLIGFLVFEAARGEFSWDVFVALLIATVIGSAMGIAGLAGLLKPIQTATQVLCALRDGREIGTIPAGGSDMAGELLSSVAHAVSAISRRVGSLEELAGRDMLTGLFNRRGFLAEMERIGRPGGMVVVLDGDGSKAVNDTYGHTAGDAVLLAMAQRLEEFAGDDAILARWGGDEFLAYFPDFDFATAVARVESLERSLFARPLIEGRPVGFTSGFALTMGGTVHELEGAIEAADRSMYRAKPDRRRTMAEDDGSNWAAA